MNDELLNRRVLHEISKAGRPISCYEISRKIPDELMDIRGALDVLIKSGDVVAFGALYAKAHGGYNPEGDTAA